MGGVATLMYEGLAQLGGHLLAQLALMLPFLVMRAVICWSEVCAGSLLYN